MKKDKDQRYRKYFTNSDLAEIFEFSSVDSFNRSTGSARLKRATNALIAKVEQKIIEKLS